MKILIIYGSYSTGTLTVSEHAQEYLQEMRHEVTLIEANKVQGVDIMEHEMTIMASPSWKVNGKQGMPHEYFFPMMERLQGQQFNKKFAVISLGDESYALVNGSADHLTEFVKTLGGHLVGKPLKIEGFHFNKDKRLGELKSWLPTILA
jgi:flavodoxin